MKKDLADMEGSALSTEKASHLSSSSCSIQASYPKLVAGPATPDLGRRKSRASVFNFSVGTTPQPPQPQPRRDGEAEGGEDEGGEAESAATLARLGKANVVRGQGGGDAATRRSEASTAAEGGEKVAVAAAVAAVAGGGGGGDSAPAQRKGSVGARVRKMSREVIGFGGGGEPPPRVAPQSLPAIEALRRSGRGGGGGALEAMGLTLGADCAAPDHVGTQNPQRGAQDAEVPSGASDSSSPSNPWARVRSRCGPSASPLRRLSHAEKYIEEVTSEAVVLPHVREGTVALPRHPRPGRCH